ncbi:DNA sulfur modification protein DndB [Bacillus cereus]|uniref:DNA sulfur modification protein DndB n=1 Tax=Bacillus cereus TaxID=1396 RepID=UPI000B4AE717|nr:DNA sulfur modification protein DndB [Bacillus cereus]
MVSKIEATTFDWNDHTCYIGKIKYKDTLKLINTSSDFSMNREIDKTRVGQIEQYIKDSLENTFFPPTILNSRDTVLSIEDKATISVTSGRFTIIDGQHRIKAIQNVLSGNKKEPFYQLISNLELPILVVEGLQNYQHRELFYLINQSSKKVDTNISERFTPKLENLLGLQYVSNNSQKKSQIEWNNKQSKERIVYLHITDCIRELTNGIYPHLKDFYDCPKDLLYKELTYANIINEFWNEYFKLLQQQNDSTKSFFRKKIALRALVEDICVNIELYFQNVRATTLTNEECCKKIIEITKNSLNSLMHERIIEYSGIDSVRIQTYKSIRNFLRLNSVVFQHKDSLNDNLKFIFKKIFDTYYEEKVLMYSDVEFSSFEHKVTELIKHHKVISEAVPKNLNKLEVYKDTNAQNILDTLLMGV